MECLLLDSSAGSSCSPTLLFVEVKGEGRGERGEGEGAHEDMEEGVPLVPHPVTGAPVEALRTRFSNDLCDACLTLECVRAVFMPCAVAGDAAFRRGGTAARSPASTDAFARAAVGCGVRCLCPLVGHVLLAAVNAGEREKTRRAARVYGSRLGDFCTHLCLGPCAQAQELLEVTPPPAPVAAQLPPRQVMVVVAGQLPAA